MTQPFNQYHLAGVILAGGQGSRMSGQDKGLLWFKERQMVDWTLSKLTLLTPDLVISCNRNQLQYSQFGFPVVSDHETDFAGPLAGIQAAMHHFSKRKTHLLVLPCDTPMIHQDSLQQLLLMSQKCPDAVVLLTADGRSHFLHAIIPLTYLTQLDDALAKGQRAVYRWYRQFPLVEVDTSQYSNNLLNINTSEQLADTA